MDTASSQNADNFPPGPARNNETIIRWALVGFAALAAVLFVLILLWRIYREGPVALLVGMVLALLPLPLYLVLALWIDRYEKEPLGMLAAAFVWGATVSYFFAIVFNVSSMWFVGLFFGAFAGEFFAAVVSAPIVEEGSKGLALFLLYWWKRDEFDGVIDGIVYAAMVGLGFATVENFYYYGAAYIGEFGGGGGIDLLLATFLGRGVLTPFLHPIFTSMTGIGLGLARQSNRTYVKVVAPLIGLLAAMVLHSLFNALTFVLGGFVGILLLLLFLPVIVLIGVVAVIFVGLRREGRIVRHYLTPELQSGLITQQEYDALGSVFGRIGSSFRALSSGGFGSWRAYSRFSQAATELAFHRDRVSRGITSVDAAQREEAYVRLISQLKGQIHTQ